MYKKAVIISTVIHWDIIYQVKRSGRLIVISIEVLRTIPGYALRIDSPLLNGVVPDCELSIVFMYYCYSSDST
jgi:hypothetical protein